MDNTEKKRERKDSEPTAELNPAELERVVGGGAVSPKPNVSGLPISSSRSDGGGATVGRAN